MNHAPQSDTITDYQPDNPKRSPSQHIKRPEKSQVEVDIHNPFDNPTADRSVVLTLDPSNNFANLWFGRTADNFVRRLFTVRFRYFSFFTFIVFSLLVVSWMMKIHLLFLVAACFTGIFFIAVVLSMNRTVFVYLCGQFYCWYTVANSIIFVISFPEVCKNEQLINIAEVFLFEIITIVYIFIDATLVHNTWSIFYGFWIIGFWGSLYYLLFFQRGFCSNDTIVLVFGQQLSYRYCALASLSNLCIFIGKQVIVEASDMIFYSQDYANTISFPIKIEWKIHNEVSMGDSEKALDETMNVPATEPFRGRYGYTMYNNSSSLERGGSKDMPLI